MEKGNSFYGWLLKQGKRDDPIGDLARDAKQDKTFPRKALTKRTYMRYLEDRHACDGAIDACREAWSEYEAS